MSESAVMQEPEDDPIEAEIILYQSDGANVPVQVTYVDETLWLTQKAIAELFGVSVSTVSEHLANIFSSGELEKASSSNSSGFSERIRSAGRPPVYFKGKGERSHRQAEKKAREEFAKFQKIQDATYENDFEKQAKRLEGRE